MAVLIRRLVLLSLAAVLSIAGPADAAGLEYLVKANFLLKFVPFVRWPSNALPNGAPFVLCIAGVDPFDGALQALAAGRRIDDRSLIVRTGVTGCNMIFVRATPALAAEMLAETADKPILTVVDDDSGSGGIIRFRLQNGRVRFDIDTVRAGRAQLELSSRLLQSAVSVRRGDGG